MIFLLLGGIALGWILLGRNEKFIDSAAKWMEALHKAYIAWGRQRQEQWEWDHPAKLFLIEYTFKAQTLAGFDVQYWMNLACERVDVQESIKEQVGNPVVEEIMAYEFRDEVFEPHFNSRSYFWHLDYRMVPALGKLYHVFPTIIGEVGEENGRQFVREVLRQRLKAEMVMMPP